MVEGESTQKGFASLRHYVLLTHSDYELLLGAMGDLCRNTDGRDWSEVGERLARYGHREFEDYRP